MWALGSVFSKFFSRLWSSAATRVKTIIATPWDERLLCLPSPLVNHRMVNARVAEYWAPGEVLVHYHYRTQVHNRARHLWQAHKLLRHSLIGHTAPHRFYAEKQTATIDTRNPCVTEVASLGMAFSSGCPPLTMYEVEMSVLGAARVFWLTQSV